MPSPRWMSLTGGLCILGCAVFFTIPSAFAQSTASTNQINAPESPSGESSSLQLAEAALPDSSAGLPSTPANPGALPSSPTPGGQQDNTDSGLHGLTHRLTFELGGGFNAPLGNDLPFITWGGNFTLGGGVRFSNRVSALFEYQFMDDKLPGAMLAVYGVSAGNAHINSLTGSPVFDLTPGKSNGIYLVGGWGYYHKSTNLQDYEEVESFYGIYDEPVTVSSITSNQWGGDLGFGIYHRVGGMFGESHTLLFAESRYTFIHTPPPSAANGFGTTELIPVSLGVRF
jgi:hypothetical protein